MTNNYKWTAELNDFDLSVLSVIKGNYNYKGCNTGSIGPFSVIDIQSMTSKSYDLVSDTIVKLIIYDLVYFKGNSIYIVDNLLSKRNK